MLQSIGSQRVGNDLATEQQSHSHFITSKGFPIHKKIQLFQKGYRSQVKDFVNYKLALANCLCRIEPFAAAVLDLQQGLKGIQGGE